MAVKDTVRRTTTKKQEEQVKTIMQQFVDDFIAIDKKAKRALTEMAGIKVKDDETFAVDADTLQLFAKLKNEMAIEDLAIATQGMKDALPTKAEAKDFNHKTLDIFSTSLGAYSAAAMQAMIITRNARVKSNKEDVLDHKDFEGIISLLKRTIQVMLSEIVQGEVKIDHTLCKHPKPEAKKANEDEDEEVLETIQAD